jgi:hypothetical protein
VTEALSSRDYVAAVAAVLADLPEPRPRFRPADRRLALDLRRRGVPIPTLRAAVRLATLRRLTRDPARPPLPPVRSLSYFLPVLDELLAAPPAPACLAYIDARLARLKPAPTPSPGLGPSAPVQNPAFSSER